MGQELPIAECTLDLDGSRRQRDRYRALGEQAAEIRRTSGALEVEFSERLDRGLLEETIATERECCPYFSFDYSPGERRLTIGVSHDDQRPALDALAYALGG